ncbi:hypothetical protein KAU11_01180 [Candidatus Babeliales bacterium]|nr:hypothetical protein [Candidatus Babeliales bacterium]
MQHGSRFAKKPANGRLKTLFDEVVHHLPYGITAVVVSMLGVWLFFNDSCIENCCQHSCHLSSISLFHILHYAHTFFASVTAVLTFRRYSKSTVGAVLVGTFVPPLFCTLSDVIFPYVGGTIMGVDMKFHICVIQNFDLILPLIVLGIVLGLFLSSHKFNGGISVVRFALGSHFLHELVSAAASLVYLISFGCADWWGQPVSVFILLTAAVVLPCMLSDVVVPIFCAWWSGKKTLHCSRCEYHGCNKR